MHTSRDDDITVTFTRLEAEGLALWMRDVVANTPPVFERLYECLTEHFETCD